MLTLQELIELLTEDPDYKLPDDATPEERRNYEEAKKRVLGLGSSDASALDDDLGFDSPFDEELEDDEEDDSDDDDDDEFDEEDLADSDLPNNIL